MKILLYLSVSVLSVYINLGLDRNLAILIISENLVLEKSLIGSKLESVILIPLILIV